MLRSVTERRVVAQRVADEVVQLRERLHSGIAGSDEDERQLARDVCRVEHGRGGLEPAQDVVAKPDGVGEVMEPEAVLGEPRDGKHA